MEAITEQLFILQDIKYRDFVAKLIPNIDKETIIGIKTPIIRAFAKELIQTDDWRPFMAELPHKYYEENALHAALVCQMKVSIEDTLNEVDNFLPYIDNWAVCDTFSPKIFAKHPDIIYAKTIEWLNSNHTYTVRYGIVTQLQYFLDKNFNSEMLTRIAKIKSPEYYINMAIAWYYSFALIKQYESTIPLFEQKKLDTWIHNKSIQKAVESLRINEECKQYLRTLRIK